MIRQIIYILSFIIATYEWGENIKLEEMSPKIREIYIRNHLDEEILDLTLDSAFKKVFSDEKNKWFLAFLIDYCTNLGIDSIIKHLRYKNNFVSSNNLSDSAYTKIISNKVIDSKLLSR